MDGQTDGWLTGKYKMDTFKRENVNRVWMEGKKNSHLFSRGSPDPYSRSIFASLLTHMQQKVLCSGLRSNKSVRHFDTNQHGFDLRTVCVHVCDSRQCNWRWCSQSGGPHPAAAVGPWCDHLWGQIAQKYNRPKVTFTHRLKHLTGTGTTLEPTRPGSLVSVFMFFQLNTM